MKFINSRISNVRNLHATQIIPTDKFNLIIGDNGSGKTSILECLYYFSHARSFRSHLSQRIITHEKMFMTLFGELMTADNHKICVGIQRDRDNSVKINLNQQPVKTAAELAILLPTILINPDSFVLLDGGPKPRRALLDWGLFHIETSYHPLWSRFQRCLKQRNMALKLRLSVQEISIWNDELDSLANQIDKSRSEYCKKLHTKFIENIEQLLPIKEIKFSYFRGWSKDNSLKSLLQDHINKDIDLGYTYYGPQRADLILKINDVPLHDFLSRGQQKIVVCALRVAQAQCLYEETQKTAIFLIDDLAAELGVEYRAFLIKQLTALNAQAFITGLDAEALLELIPPGLSKMFHVEHGVITG